jgi:hypothetical protein
VLLLLEFLLFRFYAFTWFICWEEYKRAERWRSGWDEEYKTYMAWMFPGTTIIEMWWCRQQSKLTDVIQPWTTSIYFFTLNYSITFIEFIQLLLNFRSHLFSPTNLLIKIFYIQPQHLTQMVNDFFKTNCSEELEFDSW